MVCGCGIGSAYAKSIVAARDVKLCLAGSCADWADEDAWLAGERPAKGELRKAAGRRIIAGIYVYCATGVGTANRGRTATA